MASAVATAAGKEAEEALPPTDRATDRQAVMQPRRRSDTYIHGAKKTIDYNSSLRRRTMASCLLAQ